MVISNGALVRDLVHVAEQIKAAGGVCTKEQLVSSVFPPNISEKEATQRLDRVAMATKRKDYNGNLAREVYQETYGQVGMIQPVLENGTSFYKHVPFINNKMIREFNPCVLGDQTSLIVALYEQQDFINKSHTELVDYVARKYNYDAVMISPSIEVIMAVLQKCNDSKRMVWAIQNPNSIAAIVIETLV
ncbi:hypothetical protein D3C78_17880 [compost metagenome]